MDGRLFLMKYVHVPVYAHVSYIIFENWKISSLHFSFKMGIFSRVPCFEGNLFSKNLIPR